METLKDIMKFTPNMVDGEIVCESDIEGAYICHYELKQEAINWVKELWSNGTCGVGEESDNSNSMIAWIKHFFNITEEELNDAEVSGDEHGN